MARPRDGAGTIDQELVNYRSCIPWRGAAISAFFISGGIHIGVLVPGEDTATAALRAAEHTGRALGTADFVADLERRLGHPIARRRTRPKTANSGKRSADDVMPMML
jgi:hypothetical protein